MAMVTSEAVCTLFLLPVFAEDEYQSLQRAGDELLFSLLTENKTVCTSGYAGMLGYSLLLGDS